MRSKISVVLLVIGGMLALSATNFLANGEDARPMVVTASVAISIDNSYARTCVEEVLENPRDVAASATFDFQVPEEAFISNFSLRIYGTDHFGKVIEAGTALQNYDQAVAKGENAGLLAGPSRSKFTFSTNLKARQNVTVRLVFEQILRMKGGDYTYTLCLDANTFGGARPSLEILSDINHSSEITGISVSNYTNDTVIRRPTASSARTIYACGQFAPSGNYELRYSVARTGPAGRLASCFDGQDTYFIHSFNPEMAQLGGDVMPKQIVFVLDRSGSMSGEKILQVKKAFRGILDQLRPEDEFNIVYFNSFISSWNGSLLSASKENISSAAAYIGALDATGTTDFHGAVCEALEMIRARELAAPIVVMLTDGQPTAGITSTAQIRLDARQNNTMGAPVYCLGFGSDVDWDFLKALSIENGARAFRIIPGSGAADQIRDFYTTISHPLMKNITFSYALAADINVLGGSSLYDGSEILVLGKVPGNGDTLTVRVKGVSRDGEHTFNATYDLNATPAGPAASRFWSFARINGLLDRITVVGSRPELVTAVTSISIAEGFVTPYTSMYVGVQEPEKPAPATEPSSNGQQAAQRPDHSQSSIDPTPPPSVTPSKPPAGGAQGLPSSKKSDTTKAGPANSAPFGAELIPVALLAAILALGLRKRGK